ncbi:MAG: hypothetical protein IJ597_07370, partial [Synergistaceae bacterium]|nr:hypothetical protein [Synergistaceae bacterium]
AMNLERIGGAPAQTQTRQVEIVYRQAPTKTSKENSTQRTQKSNSKSNSQNDSNFEKFGRDLITTAVKTQTSKNKTSDEKKNEFINEATNLAYQDLIEPDFEQEQDSQNQNYEDEEIAQEPEENSQNDSNFEKFGRDLIATAVKTQTSKNKTSDEKKNEFISEATNLAYQDLIAPGFEQEQEQDFQNQNYESEEITQIPEENSPNFAKLPDSPKESEFEETFSGVFEARGNGESSVIRFKDNGQFVIDSKREKSGTASEFRVTTTGIYTVNGDTITLHNKYVSMNGGMAVGTNTNSTLIIDRKKNILFDEINEELVYRGASVPIWKRTPKQKRQ